MAVASSPNSSTNSSSSPEGFDLVPSGVSKVLIICLFDNLHSRNIYDLDYILPIFLEFFTLIPLDIPAKLHMRPFDNQDAYNFFWFSATSWDIAYMRFWQPWLCIMSFYIQLNMYNNMSWKFQRNVLRLSGKLHRHSFENFDIHIAFWFRFTFPSTFSVSFNLISYSVSEILHLYHFADLIAVQLFWFIWILVE